MWDDAWPLRECFRGGVRLGFEIRTIPVQPLDHPTRAIQADPVAVGQRGERARAVHDGRLAGLAEEDRGVRELAAELGDDGPDAPEHDGPGRLEGRDDGTLGV